MSSRDRATRLGCAYWPLATLALAATLALSNAEVDWFNALAFGFGGATAVPVGLAMARVWWGAGPGKRPPEELWREARRAPRNRPHPPQAVQPPRWLWRLILRARVLLGPANAFLWIGIFTSSWGLDALAGWAAIGCLLSLLLFLVVAITGRPYALRPAVDRWERAHPTPEPSPAVQQRVRAGRQRRRGPRAKGGRAR